MTLPARELLDRALELPAEDRAEFAARLLESLHSEPQELVDAAWEKEIQRRVMRVRSGRARFTDLDTVKTRLRR